MLGQFFTAIRVAWAVNQIAARHQLKPPRVLEYHHPLVDALVDTLNGSTGVFVHWGVDGSGKTTAVREAVWRLQETAGHQVIYLHGFHFSRHGPASVWLREIIGVPEDMGYKPLTDFFNRPAATLVIDHCDVRMRDEDNRAVDFLEMVRALIKESERTGKFNVLLVINSWERAKELVDSGCKLVPVDAPARWSEEQLETLLATLPAKAVSDLGEGKDEFLCLATLSGTPGFLTYEPYNLRPYDAQYTAMHDIEWKRGSNSLYGGSFSLHCKEGRFPDKNGIYHHNDVFELKQAVPRIERRTALAMTLHERLGAGSQISEIGQDNVELIAGFCL